MINYQLVLNAMGTQSNTVNKLINNVQIASIPMDADNTDYANFKKEILADEAQLQDADGVIMADAKAYVASLP